MFVTVYGCFCASSAVRWAVTFTDVGRASELFLAGVDMMTRPLENHTTRSTMGIHVHMKDGAHIGSTAP